MKQDWKILLCVAAAGIVLFGCIRGAEKRIQTEIGVHTVPLRFQTVVVDAGHGGEDSGAVGADGTLEKDINLHVARHLSAYLSLFGFEVVMTRTADCDLGDSTLATVRERKVSDIHKRSQLLASAENAVYVGIHQNQFNEASSWGTQVFYSDNNPGSPLLAQAIQKNVVGHLQPSNTRVIKPAGDSIYILYHAEIPAVMVECGFLSNPDDLSKLNQAAYRAQMAFCIFGGLMNYNNPERIL